MKCPSCKLINPDDAIRCDCGYVFNSNQIQVSAKNPQMHSNESIPHQSNVIVTDIQMPFGSMVIFMVKWAIASIPAFIILFLISLIVYVIIGGLGGLSLFAK